MGYATPTGSNEVSCSWQCHRDRPTPSSEPGTDYAGPTSGGYGSPLYAPHNGTVVDVKTSASGGTGRYLTIDLDDGRRTRSLHLSEIWVTVGQRVARGQQVGRTGASANGSNWGVGAHVHQTLWAGHYYAFGKDATIDFAPFVGPDAIAGNQRVTGPNGANGREQPTTASPISGDMLAPGVVGNFNGWIDGENVQGNTVWFRGTSGRWFWSGGFTDTGVHDLEDLNPHTPPDLAGYQRQVVSTASANGRTEPSSQSPLSGEPLAPDTIADFDGWIDGETVEGNHVWFRGLHSGRWFWSGGFTDHGVHDLANLNPPAPVPTVIRTVAENVANVRQRPYTNALILSKVDGGVDVEMKNWAHAENVQGNDIWFQRPDLGWMWSGGFTSQSTDGLAQIEAPAPPTPTNPNNPAGLVEYAPVWDVAVVGLEAPLGFQEDGSRAPRNTKGSPPVATDGVVRYLILHHTGTTVDQLYYFSTKNDRDSCPSYYFRKNGDVFELIRPGAKPASTGKEWNYRSIAVEMLDATGSPTWQLTDEQRVRAAELAVEMYSHTVAGGGDGFWDGAPIEFALTREFIIGHNEALPGQTICPGPDARIDEIVLMAQKMWADLHPEPGPEPEPDVIEVPREDIQRAYDYLGDLLD